LPQRIIQNIILTEEKNMTATIKLNDILNIENLDNVKIRFCKETTIGFVRINKAENLWLLFHVGKVTKDLNIYNGGPAYEYEILDSYSKYFGRLIIKYKNTSQNLIRHADSVIDDGIIIERESWWKNVLRTRDFGYNSN
jgi:hypothetical protein